MTADPGSTGGSAERVLRPAPHRRLRHTPGGRLPARHGGWVLHDTTTRTRGLRHIARMLVRTAVPIALVLVLLPAPRQLRVAVAGGGISLGLVHPLAHVPETTENRAVEPGYPAGTATSQPSCATTGTACAAATDVPPRPSAPPATGSARGADD